MGYDPIFKQQPGPPVLQPAPSAAPPPTSETTTASAPLSSYPNVPQGYVPASGVNFSSNFASATPPNPSSDSTYDYGATIDPSLATGEGSAGMTTNQANQSGPETYRSAVDMPYPSKGESHFAIPRTEPLSTKWFSVKDPTYTFSSEPTQD